MIGSKAAASKKAEAEAAALKKLADEADAARKKLADEAAAWKKAAIEAIDIMPCGMPTALTLSLTLINLSVILNRSGTLLTLTLTLALTPTLSLNRSMHRGSGSS